jgi:prepilin signal peptidase PulO-like enzyme (type II secretory pathway)
MIYFLLIILGLVFGSFINALVYRLNARKPIFLDRSECPKCGHKLGAGDLVPILSFAFLRGRCRYCRGQISWQYPVVEFTAAALLALVWWIYSPDLLAVFGYSVISLFLIVIFIYDYKYYLILDSLTVPAIIFSVIFNYLRGVSLLHLLLAMITGGGFFLLQYAVSRGKWIGGGDIRLGVLAGAILGWPGVILGIFLAYLLGALVEVPLLLLGRRKLGGAVPFGTFLTVAIFIAIWWGERIITWYLGLLT